MPRGTRGPESRHEEQPRQIRQAPPPACLAGMARESSRDSASAAVLMMGEFCAHGEPTMTIFDIVIDGAQVLEMAAILDDEGEDDEGPEGVASGKGTRPAAADDEADEDEADEEEDDEGDDEDDEGMEDEPNIPLLAVRKPGTSTWYAVFRREWEERGEGLMELKRTALTADEVEQLDAESMELVRMSVGFEYPCDAASAEDVSWMAIDVIFEEADEEDEAPGEPRCIVSAEMQ